MRKIIIGVILFIFSFLFVLNFNVVKADGATVETIDGAAIRTTDPVGLKFGAHVEGDFGEDAKYGFVLSKGAFNKTEIKQKLLKDKATFIYCDELDENGDYFVSIISIPEESYLQDITVIACVEVDGVKTYATDVCTRNIYEVAQAALNNGSEDDFVESIVKASKYTVTLNFNGGNTMYASVNSAISDFLNDYNTQKSKSYTAESYYACGSWAGEFSDLVKFIYTNSNKWMWLANYLGTTATNDSNKIAASTIKNFDNYSDWSAQNSNYVYAFAYESRGWVGQARHETNVSYKSADYSDPDVQATFMPYLSSLTQTQYKVVKGESFNLTTEIPNIYKTDCEFVGWFDNPELSGNPVTVVSSGATLYAKYNVVRPKLVLEYNGGSRTYETREDMVNDLINDLNTYNKTSYTSIAEYQTSRPANFFKTSSSYRDKWIWIFAELIDLAKAGKTNGNWDKSFLSYFNTTYDGTSISGYATENIPLYCLRIDGATWNSDYKDTYGSLASLGCAIDCRNLDVNSFRAYQEKYKEVLFTDSIDLPTVVYKEGYIFDGWYLKSDFSGSAVTSVEGLPGETITVYAKWTEAN